MQVTLAAKVSCCLVICLFSDLLLFGLVRKARALARGRYFGSQGACLGLPRPQVILESRLDEFSYPQASTRIRTEATAEASCSWTEWSRRELFF